MHPLAAVLKQSVRWDTRTSSRISPETVVWGQDGGRWKSQRMTMLSLLFCSLPVLVDDDVVVRGLI